MNFLWEGKMAEWITKDTEAVSCLSHMVEKQQGLKHRAAEQHEMLLLYLDDAVV